jgi:hypothetical protein
MMGVAAKLQNVPLCDAHMLEKPPRRVRQRFRTGAAKVDGQIGNGCLEIDMSGAAVQQVYKVFP